MILHIITLSQRWESLSLIMVMKSSIVWQHDQRHPCDRPRWQLEHQNCYLVIVALPLFLHALKSGHEAQCGDVR